MRYLKVKKKLFLLFSDNRKITDIAHIFGINHSTAYQNYNLIIKKISVKLINNKDFLSLIKTLPEYLRDNMFRWIEDIKENHNIKRRRCPICRKMFNSKFDVKKHLQKENDKKHLKYYKDQIKFIKTMLKKHGFSVKWIYKHKDYLLFSLSWIWNYWEKKYESKITKTLRRIFRQKRQR